MCPVEACAAAKSKSKFLLSYVSTLALNEPILHEISKSHNSVGGAGPLRGETEAKHPQEEHACFEPTVACETGVSSAVLTSWQYTWAEV